MPIKVLALHHHAVAAGQTPTEVSAVREFYAAVLGLDADAGRPDFPGIPGAWLDVGEHAQLHLIGSPARSADDTIDPRAPHVALAVQDILKARAEIERLGIEYRAFESPHGPQADQLFLRDPAGNLIELHQAGTCRCTPRTRSEASGGYASVEGAVMFADMRGFTALSERLSPLEVVPLLNEYFALLTAITLEHGGTVFNLAGDGLMAGFGVPREDADAPRRALDSACEMLARFRQMAGEWKLRLDIDTGIGIGISAGEVIVGNVGAPSHMSYTLIGDTVNVAARLSQRARAGEALFSSAVKRSLEACGRNVPAVALPALQLRGRAAPIDTYCLPADGRIDFRPAPVAQAAMSCR